MPIIRPIAADSIIRLNIALDIDSARFFLTEALYCGIISMEDNFGVVSNNKM